MRFGVVNLGEPLLSVRIALIAGLILLLSAWTTCNAMFVFNGCEGSIPQPKITSPSPNAVPGDGESVLLSERSQLRCQLADHVERERLADYIH